MKHIVTVGGGTGSYTVLSGLKTFPDVFLTALVSMADDGGSTGVLRRKWGVMPPGDVRQCLVALSGKEFLNRRVGRHKLGNILLAVMEKITGDFSRGLKILSFVFNAKGKIIPITKDAAVLCAELKGGEVITGESKIDTADLQTENGGDNLERIFYERNTILNPLGRDAILAADYIIIGPGVNAFYLIQYIAFSGKHYYGKVAQEDVFLQAAADLSSVNVRHIVIQDY